MKFKLHLISAILFIIFPYMANTYCGKGNDMSKNKAFQRLLQIVADSQEKLPTRIQILNQLVDNRNKTITIELQKLFSRTKPEPIPMKNWDPVAAERVVDLYIIKALFILGDDSFLDRLPLLIEEAGNILIGPDDEFKNASSVILQIGRVELIEKLITMTEDTVPQSVKNAVLVLNQLQLPQSPIGGDVSSVFKGYNKDFTFDITTLKQELEIFAELSQGKIVLSSGTKSFINSNDYERGPVKRENVILTEIIEQDIPMLDFDYYIANQTVVICTHNEAGQQWRIWWEKYKTRLVYQKETTRFILSNE